MLEARPSPGRAPSRMADEAAATARRRAGPQGRRRAGISSARANGPGCSVFRCGQEPSRRARGRSAAIGPEICHRPTTQSRPWRLAGAELPAVLHRPDDFVGRQCDVAAGDHLRRPCPWHLQRSRLRTGCRHRPARRIPPRGRGRRRPPWPEVRHARCRRHPFCCTGRARRLGARRQHPFVGVRRARVDGRGRHGAVLPRVHGACARGRERQPAPGGQRA